MAPAWAWTRRAWRRAAATVAFGVCAALGLTVAACVRAPRMCVGAAGCAAGSACVAGRCLSQAGSPAIATATRALYDPVDAAYLAPGQAPVSDGIAVFGQADGAMALYRFAVPLAPEASVVEAYLLMERAADVDSDPAPVLLHTARVVAAWDSRSISWARQPALEEVGGAQTWVPGSSSSVVRLEVRAMVERWRRRRHDDFGLVVLAEGHSPTGVSFVLPARLELYVK
jgi:hypothetical protein